MNILHMKYAVEVADAGSINRASEKLLIAQPNLSRSIKDLEDDLGITIFDRSSKGMTLTEEGAEFVKYSRKILAEMDEIEHRFRADSRKRPRLYVCVPRVSYISEAFVSFASKLDDASYEIIYKETSAAEIISSVASEEAGLGVIRYSECFEKYFLDIFKDRDFKYKEIAKFTSNLIVKEDSPLAKMDEIRTEDLKDYVAVTHSDPYIPMIPVALMKREAFPDICRSKITIYERASQFELLARLPKSFMWAASVPQQTLKHYGLVSLKCKDFGGVHKDVIIYRRGSKLSELAEGFRKELEDGSKRV